MKKLLTLITLLFGLVGCTSQTELDVKTEKLHSFLIVENKLYAVGELHDYEFENKLVTELNHFLQSPFANKIQGIEVAFAIKDSPNVKGSYQVSLSPKALSEQEMEKLKTDFGFELDAEQLIKTYHADGKVVKLANREEILQKFRFKQPLDATLTYYNTRNQMNAVAEGAISIVMLPVGIAASVIALPVFVIWVASCAYHDC